MTTTRTSDQTEPAWGFTFPGWRRPGWATEMNTDTGSGVTFRRYAERVPMVYASPDPRDGDEMVPCGIHMLRSDDITADEDGTMRVLSTPVLVHLDIEELPISEARALAEALTELADWHERDAATR